MALVKSHSDPYFQHLPKCCSICGDPLRPPFIYWEARTTLAAHPNCVEPVAWALLRDVWELKIGREQVNKLYWPLKRSLEDGIMSPLALERD